MSKTLKNKLEKTAFCFGTELNNKINNELYPVYKLFKLIIIIGFLNTIIILSTILYVYNQNMNHNCVCEEIKYDRK